MAQLAFGNDVNRIEVGVAGGSYHIHAAATCGLRAATTPKSTLRSAQTPLNLARHLDCVKVGFSGGIVAILAAMAFFPLDADVQSEACTAVTNVSHNCDRNRRRIVKHGGVVLILNAMQVPTIFALLDEKRSMKPTRSNVDAHDLEPSQSAGSQRHGADQMTCTEH